MAMAENKFRTYVSVKAEKHKNDVFIYVYKIYELFILSVSFFSFEKK